MAFLLHYLVVVCSNIISTFAFSFLELLAKVTVIRSKCCFFWVLPSRWSPQVFIRTNKKVHSNLSICTAISLRQPPGILHLGRDNSNNSSSLSRTARTVLRALELSELPIERYRALLPPPNPVLVLRSQTLPAHILLAERVL